MKKLFSFLSVLVIASMFSVSVFALTNPADPRKDIESGINADTGKDITAAATEAKEDVVKKEDVKAFKGKFTGLFTQLNTLRAECKGYWEQLKGLNGSIKSQWTSVKTAVKAKKTDSKKIFAEVKAKLDPVRSQVKAIHNSIQSLRDQKKTEWTNFGAAVRARDEGKAAQALNNIISLKKQIIENQKTLIAQKSEILSILKGYSA